MSTAILPARSGPARGPVKGPAGVDIKPEDKSSGMGVRSNVVGDLSQPRRATLPLLDPSISALPLAFTPPISSSPPLKAPIPIPAHLLRRRRSSFPPTTPTTNGPTSLSNTPDSLAAEANLLDLFSTHTQRRQSSASSTSITPTGGVGMPFEASSLWNAFSNIGTSKRDTRRQSEPIGRIEGTSLRLPSPSQIAQYGSDLAWKTILGSVVEVEGVGSVQVSRVLQEIWARGGGDTVTAQSLWPAIIVSLSLPTEDHNFGDPVSSPAPHAASALQALYTLTLRHWEPAIFSGLLATFGQPGLPLPAPGPVPEIVRPAESTPPIDAFGINTPVRGMDLSQWMNLTPGADWSLLGGTGLTPRRGSLAPSLPGPSGLAFELGDFTREKEVDSSLSTTARGEEERSKGLGELLAQMEEGREAAELLSHLPIDDPKGKGKAKLQEASYLPTPDTETDNDTPLEVTRRSSSESRKAYNLTPPESSNEPTPTSAASNLLASTHASTPGSSVSAGSGSSGILPTKSSLRPHPMALTMPTSTFVPPPPMCMFFSPAFHDLQNGKVGIWKGDLHVQGRGGGKFSVLIVGETSTGHAWQSHTWPSTITYPVDPQPNQSCTATMMPVAHLAREGFTPAAMGMVLCNDANISQYVAMVQGLHAEGVAFHLSTPGKLPIIFLPAKFSSEDPLQRLGIAFMTKPGIPLPPPPTGPTNLGHVSPVEGADGPRKKKRRQSAPAQTSPPIPLPPSKTTSGSGTHKRRQSTAVHTRSGGTRLDRSIAEEKT